MLGLSGQRVLIIVPFRGVDVLTVWDPTVNLIITVLDPTMHPARIGRTPGYRPSRQRPRDRRRFHRHHHRLDDE